MIRRLLGLAFVCYALTSHVAAQEPCESSAQARVQRVRAHITSDWNRALPEATLLLNVRTAGSECARREVIPVISVRQTEDVVGVLINVARSDPDRLVRMSAIQQLSLVTTPNPELTRFLGELPLRMPLNAGHVGVIVVRGLITDSGGAPMAGATATITLSAAGCPGQPLLALRTVTEKDGRYEVAFNRGRSSGSACLALQVGQSSTRTEMTSVQSAGRMRSDTVRLDLTTSNRRLTACCAILRPSYRRDVDR